MSKDKSRTNVTPKDKDEPLPDTVKISAGRPLFFYVDFTLRALAEHQKVTLSGLGQAISRVVTVAEILKNQNAVVYEKIETKQSDSEDTKTPKPKIEIVVARGTEFEAYKGQRLGLAEEKQNLRTRFEEAQKVFQEKLELFDL